MENFESRLAKAKALRESLVSKVAAEKARYEDAQQALKKLEDKAATYGFTLEELPQIIEAKKDAFEEKLKAFEENLAKAQNHFDSFDKS